jgi:hypothetical protein
VSDANRRNVKRVPAEKLPPAFRQFLLSFGPKEVYLGKTIDASLTGIAFHVEVPVYRIREFLVKMVSADKKISMSQEIVYIKPIDEGNSRVSFLFKEESTPPLYRKAVREAMRG